MRQEWVIRRKPPRRETFGSGGATFCIAQKNRPGSEYRAANTARSAQSRRGRGLVRRMEERIGKRVNVTRTTEALDTLSAAAGRSCYSPPFNEVRSD